MKPGHAYLVEWVDATHTWEQPKEIGEVCRAIGWLVEETDAGVLLALESDAEGKAFRFYMAIPAGMILSYKLLTVDD